MSELGDVLMESLEHNYILMHISTLDMDLITKGKKTVIIQRKLPNEVLAYRIISRNKLIKVYLYNKQKGVFGECFCNLSFNNDLNKQQPCYFPYRISKNAWDYEKNAEKYITLVRKQNEGIRLDGTCLTYDNFINLIGIGRFIFFIIKDLTIYDNLLSLDDFYIARFGKNGEFKPSKNFSYPSTWCYVVKRQRDL